MSRFVRPYATFGLGAPSVCRCVCVSRATRHPPPLPPPTNIPSLSAHPPGSWVSLGIGGNGARRGRGRGKGKCGSWRNPNDYGSSDAGARQWATTRFWPSLPGACSSAYLLTYLPACLPACHRCRIDHVPHPPAASCVPPPVEFSPPSLLVAGRKGKGEGEKEGRSGPGRFTPAAQSGVSQGGLGALVRQGIYGFSLSSLLRLDCVE